MFLFLQINVVANTLSFNGQFWSLGYQDNQISNSYNLQLGYIPKMSFSYVINNQSIIDFEYDYYILKNHNNYDDNKITTNKYRSWVRFSNNNLDIRIGLQKIAFGTALFLRSLAWFDSLDFTVTTEQTYGVEGLRFRYYPSNSLAIWFWIIENNISNPSYGSRLEMSNLIGDWGFTYYQDADSTKHSPYQFIESNQQIIRENNRLGIDYRYDGNFGFWIEGCYYIVKKHEDVYFNKFSFLTLGFDYTIPTSKGILLSTETMFSHMPLNHNASDLLISLHNDKNVHTIFHLSCPIDMINNLTFYSLRDWDRSITDNFVRWSTTYDSFNIDYMLTLKSGGFNDVFQIMFVYNH